MREGWKCPSCGKSHGPHVDTCPGGGTEGVELSPSPFDPSQVPYPHGPVKHPEMWKWRPQTIPDPSFWRSNPNSIDPLVRQWSANFTGVN